MSSRARIIDDQIIIDKFGELRAALSHKATLAAATIERFFPFLEPDGPIPGAKIGATRAPPVVCVFQLPRCGAHVPDNACVNHVN